MKQTPGRKPRPWWEITKYGKEVVEPLQTFLEQTRVHVEEEIVNILQRDLEILDPELKWKLSACIEILALRPIADGRHLTEHI